AVALPYQVFGIASFGSTALLSWNVGPTVVVRSVDEDGTTIATNEIHSMGDDALTPNIVPTREGALVVWTITRSPFEDGATTQVYAQPVTATAALAGDLFVVPTADRTPHPWVAGVGTAHGALIMYGLEDEHLCGDHYCPG